MAKVTISDVQGLLDPLQGCNFNFIIPNIPGVSGSEKSRGLNLRCQTTNAPGSSVDDMEATLHGVTLKFAGRRIYSHTMNSTFIETREMLVRDVVRAWLDKMRDSVAGTGSYASEYKTDALMQILDDKGNVTRTIHLFGLFVKNMNDMSFDGSSSGPVTVDVEWSYDYYLDE